MLTVFSRSSAILRLKGEAGRKAKKEKISAVSREMFDFTELSKRSLGQNWNKMNPDQQKEFIRLFKSLLEDTYADKITSYTDEKLVFGKEIPLSEKNGGGSDHGRHKDFECPDQLQGDRGEWSLESL